MANLATLILMLAGTQAVSDVVDNRPDARQEHG